MSIPSLSVNAGDFAEIKESFKTFLGADSRFADFDFDGANITQLLNLLSYNTYLNLFYHNMSVNETFIDTAVLRDSIVSRAKELNYVPRSFKSATATVDVSISSTDLNRSSIVIPKGTIFTSRIADRSYTFTTDRSYVTTESSISGGVITFVARDVELFEGYYLTETFAYEAGKFYTIPNEQVDISSITVTVIEENGGELLAYTRANSLFGLGATSKVFFIQGTSGSKYEIGFGDDVFGRAPKANAILTVDYRISNGELPNGVREFRAGQGIDGETVITVTTTQAAHSGAVHETEESIRFNAPRHFESQQNAVTSNDYKSLLSENFPEIIDVAAYGGEEAIPPQFGRVMVGVVLTGLDYMPDSKRLTYLKFLKDRTMMTPVFVDPEYIYPEVTSLVSYNITQTPINSDDVKTLVIDAITEFSTTNLNGFDKTLRYSRLTSAIDDAHASIISNGTTLRLNRILRSRDWVLGSVVINYGNAISSVQSDPFLFNAAMVYLTSVDESLVLVNQSSGQVIKPVGTVDYTTGEVSISAFAPDDTTTPISLFAVPTSKDIASTLNTILKIRESDVKVTVTKSR